MSSSLLLPPVVIRPEGISVFDPLLAKYAVFVALNGAGPSAAIPIRLFELLSLESANSDVEWSRVSDDPKVEGINDVEEDDDNNENNLNVDFGG